MSNFKNLKLTDELRQIIGNSDAQPVTVGESGTQVWHLDNDTYLKTSPRNYMRAVKPEMERLKWMQGKLPVPEIVYYGEDDTTEYLLTTVVPGRVSYEETFANDVETIVQRLAEGLRMFHAISIEDCPFDETLDTKLATAHQHVIENKVDADDFAPNWVGYRPDDLYTRLLNTRPKEEDLVFTHGDYCLPNILIDPDDLSITGFVDLGRAGVADRYQDVALCARSLSRNWGDAWVMPFYEAYGLDTIDVKKSLYFRLLDEFF